MFLSHSTTPPLPHQENTLTCATQENAKQIKEKLKGDTTVCVLIFTIKELFWFPKQQWVCSIIQLFKSQLIRMAQFSINTV